jgi:hypothetical protein
MRFDYIIQNLQQTHKSDNIKVPAEISSEVLFFLYRTLLFISLHE